MSASPDDDRTDRAGLGRRSNWTIGGVVAALMLVTQVLWATTCPLREASFFCLDPHQTATAFSLDVVVDGEELSSRQIRSRYGLLQRLDGQGSGWEAHDIDNLLYVIRLVEREGSDDTAVTVRYSINGAPTQTWQWPER